MRLLSNCQETPRFRRAGDIVVELNCLPVTDVDDLHQQLTGERVRVKSTLTVIRHNEKLELEVIPEESRVRND